MNHSQSQRIAIVGGGFAGISLAARLAQSGLPVTLLETADLGFDASSRNQGWLHSGGWFAPEHPDLARMCYASLQQTVQYCPECLEPNHDGMYYLFSRIGTAHLEWVKAWKTVGIPFTEVSREQVARSFPDLDETQLQHAFMLPDRAFRPQVLLERLAADARNAGAEIRTHAHVAELLRDRDRVLGVRMGTGEEIRARFTILATGAWDWSSALMPPADVGQQSEYTRIVLKTHLVAFRPEVGSWPFCVIDRDGFNHVPHLLTSVFGTTRWQVVKNPADHSVNIQETELIWKEIQNLFPTVNRNTVVGLREWAGTTVQMMHCDQIIPGEAPFPSVINHSLEPPRCDNLWSVSPGRATLWAHLAEEARKRILDSLGDGPVTTTSPPWAMA